MFPKWYRAVCCRLRDSRATMVITRLETLPCPGVVPQNVFSIKNLLEKKKVFRICRLFKFQSTRGVNLGSILYTYP